MQYFFNNIFFQFFFSTIIFINIFRMTRFYFFQFQINFWDMVKINVETYLNMAIFRSYAIFLLIYTCLILFYIFFIFKTLLISSGWNVFICFNLKFYFEIWPLVEFYKNLNCNLTEKYCFWKIKVKSLNQLRLKNKSCV